MNPLARFGYLSVAILDANLPSAQTVRRILTTLNITRTHQMRDKNELLSSLGRISIDVLMADMSAPPDGGLQLLRDLRAPESPNRTLPVIMTSWDTSEGVFQTARDAGANEFLLRPYSLNALARRFLSIIDQPRRFFLTRNYCGPDRRRTGLLPSGVAERRVRAEPVLILPEGLNEIYLDERPRFLLPDFSLKSKLEASAAELKGIESIMPANSAANHADDYAQWLLSDVEAIRQAARNLAVSPENARPYIERILNASHSVRMRGQAAGYGFAVRVADGLARFCRNRFRPGHAPHLVVIGKHADTLHAIFMQRLTGDINPLAEELLDELNTLVQKYSS